MCVSWNDPIHHTIPVTHVLQTPQTRFCSGIKRKGICALPGAPVSVAQWIMGIWRAQVSTCGDKSPQLSVRSLTCSGHLFPRSLLFTTQLPFDSSGYKPDRDPVTVTVLSYKLPLALRIFSDSFIFATFRRLPVGERHTFRDSPVVVAQQPHGSGFTGEKREINCGGDGIKKHNRDFIAYIMEPLNSGDKFSPRQVSPVPVPWRQSSYVFVSISRD